MRAMGKSITGTVVGAVVGLVLLTPAANASCAFMPLEQSLLAAESAFTGTVEGLREPGHVASVRVGRVWKGPDVHERVVVRGGQPQSAWWPLVRSVSSVDLTFTPGEEYLFVLPIAQNFSVTSCSGTTPLDDQVRSLEPVDSRPPLPGATQTFEVALLRMPLVWVAGGLVLVLGAVMLLRKRPRLS